MDTADVKGKLNPQNSRKYGQDTSIWMVPETFGDLMYGLLPGKMNECLHGKGPY